jgi:hypothetical protein
MSARKTDEARKVLELALALKQSKATRYVKGEKGDRGEPGLKGDKGDRGEKGDKGDRGGPGPKGDDGQRGEKGERGIRGDQGERGLRGERGDRGEKGDRGEPGKQGVQGKPGMRWRGPWRSSKTYDVDDVVEYSGSSYIAVQSTTGSAPGGNPAWELVARKGADGAAARFFGASGSESEPGGSGGITQEQADARYAGLNHTHEIADVDGLQAALDSKEAANTAFNLVLAHELLGSHLPATQSTPGFMSAADKAKLDGIQGVPRAVAAVVDIPAGSAFHVELGLSDPLMNEDAIVICSLQGTTENEAEDIADWSVIATPGGEVLILNLYCPGPFSGPVRINYMVMNT